MIREEITGRCPMDETDVRCPMDETDLISHNILYFLKKKLKKLYGRKKPFRIFHAKSIGLVHGKLIVEKNLNARLKQGMFKQPGEYDLRIRFSNGNSTVTSDNEKALRGMAIKVLKVQSCKNPDNAAEGHTQDIILLNIPFFVPGIASRQMAAMKLLLGNFFQKLDSFFKIFLPFLSINLKFLKKVTKTANILEEMYFSTTPYCFGEKEAIKWHVRPLKTITSVLPENPGENFLRDRLIRDLSPHAKEDVAFALYVQFQENEKTEPIEDVSVTWKTEFHPVGIITIPKQNIDTEDRKQEDEKMTFSPGRTIVEHAPLGGVNMIRKKVYEQLAKERLKHP